MDINTLNIPEAVKGLKEKEFSSVELTQACLDQIKKHDNKFKGFITITEEQALKQAKDSDDKRSNGEDLSMLAGIPVSVKDVIATKGIKTTAGSKILKNYIAPYNATAVEKLNSLGAVIVGKTNCDEFAHGASTENSAFGASYNPWDITRVPGGSSGGAAVSVSADECIYALGTDTGGSIRQPASFCNTSAIKPTYGRVSRYGLFSMTSSTDCLSPMSKTVEGLAFILEVIAGQDKYDSTTPDVFVPKYSQLLGKADMSKIRIGIPKEYFVEGMNESIRKLVEDAIQEYKTMGAKIIPVSLPHTSYAVAVYYIITPSEISSNLARFDGIRFGFSASTDQKLSKEIESLFDVYSKTRRHGFGDESKRRIMLGTYSLSSGYYDAYYKKASQVRTLIRDEFNKVFKEVDLILTPTSPKVAFKIGEQNENPLQMYLEDIFVAPASLAGLPAMSIPCGFASPNEDDTMSLPVGLQLIASQFEEVKLLQAGNEYQKITDWHKKKPNLK